jgi:streptogramin lyase
MAAVRADVRWRTPGPQPNGLAATSDGLWVIDQRDLRAYLLRWQDGSELHSVPTATAHSSGITWDGSTLWVASTFHPIALFQIDGASGQTLRTLPTPGAGKSGAHGLEWIAGKLWVAVPPSSTIYELDPRDGQVLRSFAAPGSRPHGLAWDGAGLWCVETNHRNITRYGLEGETLATIELPDSPEPHGLTLWDGCLWYCDATTREVCTLPLPA